MCRFHDLSLSVASGSVPKYSRDPAVDLSFPFLSRVSRHCFKPGLYSVRRSTQTLLRKRVYADTRVMGVYRGLLLRRSPRVSTQTYAIAVCVPFQ